MCNDILPICYCLDTALGYACDSTAYSANLLSSLIVHCSLLIAHCPLPIAYCLLLIAYREASQGIPATRPVIEMTIPSALDSTLIPANSGKHVVQLFVQYAPYDVSPQCGRWSDEHFKNAFADRCFHLVDQYAPGFSQSVIARDVLSPWDLEQIFGLPGGNISHGALSLDQLGYCRPVPGFATHRTPMKGLYLCSGTLIV
jgi:phytoene dehydrogenase-like protein